MSPEEFEQLFGGGGASGYSTIFDTLFSGQRGGRSARSGGMGFDTRAAAPPQRDVSVQITLEEALELLRQPKRGRKRAFGVKKAAPLKEFGTNPEGAAVRLFDGRYGPYVTDGAVNATVPKGVMLKTITLESALEWLVEKAARGPSKRPRARKKRA